MAEEGLPQTQTDPSQVSDPYVIYQLRKPNQRGTAVIPRFVPNTHAPAVSPANYRFARVWTANNNNPSAASPSALHHVPRSFEYAGSLGSESSLWSDTSSWLSVSSLRTAPSEARAPLLYSNQNPVSAASFFSTDLDNVHLRNAYRASSARSSELDSPIRSDFPYPAALSESVSEDAVIDDLLSLHKAQFPEMRNHSNVQRTPSKVHSTPQGQSLSHRQSSRKRAHASSHHRSDNTRSNHNRAALLPTLTHKRRSLWQWLFCTNKAAMSTTVPSVTISQTATAVRERMRPANPSSHAHDSKTSDDPTRHRASTKQQSGDRLPKADKEFLHRTQKAPDAPATKSRSTRRRNLSFEIRKGRPSGTTKSGRSMSWNFMSRGLLGRDRTAQKKRKPKSKNTARRLPVEEPREPRKLHRIVFQRSKNQKRTGPERPASKGRRRSAPKQTQRLMNEKSPKELSKPMQNDEDRARADRPREDRPRDVTKPLLEKMSGAGAPQPKSIVPSLREKQASGSAQIQRMRSSESSDPVTSRISSDLSSTTYGRTNGSESSRSTSSRLRNSYRPTAHEIDPAANGVSSDVSSHVSGAIGKTSPTGMRGDHVQDYSNISSPEIQGIDPNIMSQDSPHRAPLFAFPSTSSTSGGFTETQSKGAGWDSPPANYAEHMNAFGNVGSTAPELIAMMDPVARAKEKNRARSAGGPLSYLMRQHDPGEEINSQSTGLTSLADESVSTHKTVSVTGDEYQYRSQLSNGLHRQLYPETFKSSKSQEVQESRPTGNTGTGKPIFKNYPMHSSGSKSPSHASSGASPRRFHSDWSDPHATDIDVYCQCNCSCVYEEECRRSCELIYGRSPSVSSTRSRHGYKGFQTLPPAVQTNGGQNYTAPKESHEKFERELPIPQYGLNGAPGSTRSSKRSYTRGDAVDELPDSESERIFSEAYKSSDLRQRVVGGMHGVYRSGGKPLDPAEKRVPVRGNPRAGYGREPGAKTRYQDPMALNDQTNLTHMSLSSSESRVPTPMAGVRRDQRVLEKVGQGGKDRKHRGSSRRGGQHGRSHKSSERAGRQPKPRSEGTPDKSSKGDHKRKNRQSRAAQEWEAGRRSDNAQQMGNSYVVRRSGPPPPSQAHVMQPQRNIGLDQDIGYDPMEQGLEYEREAPVVELEYERRDGLGGSRNRKESPRDLSKEKVQKGKSRSRSGQKRQQTKSGEESKRSKSRQTSKNSSRSRTPVFGVF